MITSQNDTAPKPSGPLLIIAPGVITSQNDTAPKLHLELEVLRVRVITSQNDTAPKLLGQNPLCKGRQFQLEQASLELKKMQVNCPFLLIFIDCFVSSVFKKKHVNF